MSNVLDYDHLMCRIMEYKPQSVLEIECGRGKLLKLFNDLGVSAHGISSSDLSHRVVNNINRLDVNSTPWPIDNKSIDVCYSYMILDQLPRDIALAVVAESERVSKNCIHFVNDKSSWVDYNNVVFAPYVLLSSSVSSDYLLKVNLGCGDELFGDGWRNIDINDTNTVTNLQNYSFIRHDVRKGLWFDDDSVDFMLSSNMIEYMTYDEVSKLLLDCYNAITPGGVIRISTLDHKKVIDDYINGNVPAQREHGGCIVFNLTYLDMVAMANKTYKHKELNLISMWNSISHYKSVYDAYTLMTMMKRAGFNDVRNMPFGMSRSKKIQIETYDSLPDSSIYIEATK